MPASLGRIRREMKVKRSDRDKGWILTIELGVYDNGMITVNGTPINTAPEYDQAHGWTGAAMVVAQHINEFRHELQKGIVQARDD